MQAVASTLENLYHQLEEHEFSNEKSLKLVNSVAIQLDEYLVFVLEMIKNGSIVPFNGKKISKLTITLAKLEMNPSMQK